MKELVHDGSSAPAAIGQREILAPTVQRVETNALSTNLRPATRRLRRKKNNEYLLSIFSRYSMVQVFFFNHSLEENEMLCL